MSLEVLVYPHSALRQPAQSVDEITDEVRSFCLALGKAMIEGQGVGIAAPQVGDLRKIFALNCAVIGVGDSGQKLLGFPPESQEACSPVVFVNPQIVYLGNVRTTDNEACMSLPGFSIPVDRADQVRVQAIGLDGKVFEAEAQGFGARAIQHEMDHLDGRMIIDYLPYFRREAIKKKLRKMRRIK